MDSKGAAAVGRMSYRERMAAALAQQPVDRAPFDLAGTSLTGACKELEDGLRSFLGFPKDDGPCQRFDERILKRFDVDFRLVGGILNPKGLSRKISETENVDCWGIRRVFTGLYWDIVESPLNGAAVEDLERYPWPDAEDVDPQVLEAWRAEAKRLHDETPYVVVADHPVFGVFELGCWICGFDDFLLKMALDPDFVLRFFEIVLEFQKKTIELYYGALGDYIHATTSGDDFGTQSGPFLSPEMFASLVVPFLRERIAHTRRFTKASYFHHSCGAVFPLVPHLIDAGVEILNPIQPGAKDMEPEKLKAAYGGRMAFWGGVDTQRLLREGSVEEVEAAVFHVLDAMQARNGGYVLAPAHNLQANVPPENVVAMYEAGAKYFQRA